MLSVCPGSVSSFEFRNSPAFIKSFEKSKLRRAKCWDNDISWKHTSVEDPGFRMNVRCLEVSKKKRASGRSVATPGRGR